MDKKYIKQLIKSQKTLTLIVTGMLLAVLFWAGQGESVSVNGNKVLHDDKAVKIVIDAGHGGNDPGKIGINGALEKDINLQIAMLLKSYLEAQDVEVVMTRETDDGLYDTDSSNKKVQDMKRRIGIIDETAPALTVSIHQNSYPEEYVSGAQVFYYTGSAEGQKSAVFLQDSLIRRLDPENHRQVKANDSYYLLKKTSTPIVIVECGFLSNSVEAEKLCDSSYQERVAWAIHIGVLQYLNTSSFSF